MKKLLEKRINKELCIILCCGIFFIGIIFVWNLEKILLPKYFADSQKILKMIQNEKYYEILGDSYGLAASIFSFFPISELKIYSIVIYMLFFPIYIYIIIKNSRSIKIIFLELIFFVLSIIYLLRPGKEIIQLVILLICYLNKKYIFIILLCSGIFFRSYLILQGVIYLGVYILVKTKYKKIYIVILIISFILVNIKYPELINIIFNVRNEVNKYRIGSADAKSMIINIFEKNELIYIYVNYLLNMIRMLFPIELLIKNIKYFPYILFQIYLSIKLFKWRRMIKNEYIILLYSYILISVIFEPDFGSFLRHTVPYLIFIIDLEVKNEKSFIYNK